MLARVKRYVPTTVMDTELQDSILERMNYLVSLDLFPFQEVYNTVNLASSNYRLATPSNFATVKSLVIWTDGYERSLEILSSGEFDRLFPNPSINDEDTPCFACIRVAEGEIWLNCPTDATYTFRLYFTQIPDDATDTTVSQLVELAKIAIYKWGCADGFRMLSEHDRADKLELEGDKMFAALKRRYQLAQEEGARIISLKERHQIYKAAKYTNES